MKAHVLGMQVPVADEIGKGDHADELRGINGRSGTPPTDAFGDFGARDAVFGGRVEVQKLTRVFLMNFNHRPGVRRR
jgi:hypothetical protein